MTARRPQPVATTTVSSRYQTVIPSEIREKFAVREGTRVLWIDKGDSIEIVPLPEKPWKQFQGAGRADGYLVALGEYRSKERDNDPKTSIQGDRGGASKAREK